MRFDGSVKLILHECGDMRGHAGTLNNQLKFGKYEHRTEGTYKIQIKRLHYFRMLGGCSK